MSSRLALECKPNPFPTTQDRTSLPTKAEVRGEDGTRNPVSFFEKNKSSAKTLKQRKLNSDESGEGVGKGKAIC